MTVIYSILASLYISVLTVLCIYLFCVALSTKIVLTRTPKYESNSKLSKIVVAVTLAAASVMAWRFGYTFELLKWTLMLLTFMFASVCDIKERKVEDYVPVFILLIGLINVPASLLWMRAVAFAVSFIFMTAVAIVSDNKIGGADVKYISACTFALGIGRGLFGLILGLLAAVICTAVRNKIKKTDDDTLPLIPYLSVGYLLGCLI